MLLLPRLLASSFLSVLAALILVPVLALGCGLVSGGAGGASGAPSDFKESAGLVDGMMEEYDLNPLRAKGTYVGTRQPISGKIKEIGTDLAIPPFVYLVLDIRGGIRATFAQRLPLGSRNSPPWPGYAWLDDVDVGDWVEVRCTVTDIRESLFSGGGSQPRLEECEFLGSG